MNAEFSDQWRRIYVDGVPRMATRGRMPGLVKDFDGVFFTDSEGLPRTRCAQHRLPRGATDHLERGGRVYTSGNWYSLKPPEAA